MPSLPDWATSTAGSKIRVALWLASEIRPGGTFTKAQLRDAFPSVEQIDRRMRDLRGEGWVIATYREDRSLALDELRLVTIGGPVWEKGYRSRASSDIEASRRATLAADDYLCRYCGIGAGEPYPEDPLRTAKLSVATVETSAGRAGLTLCDRCLRSASAAEPVADVLDAVRALPAEARASFREWVRDDQRPRTLLEELWSRYRRLPADARTQVEHLLDQLQSSAGRD